MEPRALTVVKRNNLSRVEEWILLTIKAQHPDAYGVAIQEHILKATGQDFSFGTIYATVERLEEIGRAHV